VIYTLPGSCRRHGTNPFDYLKHLFTAMPVGDSMNSACNCRMVCRGSQRMMGASLGGRFSAMAAASSARVTIPAGFFPLFKTQIFGILEGHTGR
jgi:hypothetical protein